MVMPTPVGGFTRMQHGIDYSEDYVCIGVAVARGKGGRTLDGGRPFSYPYWEPNAHGLTTLTVDMDQSDSERRLAAAVLLGLVPAPDYYIVNDAKGTLQASWRMEPLPEFHSMASDWLYHRVLESLRRTLGGDPRFTDARRRCPYCVKRQRVMQLTPMPALHRLSDLRGELERAGSFDDGHVAKSSSTLVSFARSRIGASESNEGGRMAATASAVHPRGERNDAAFHAAIAAARSGDDPLAAARSVVCEPPLSDCELRCIADSATRCAKRRRTTGTSSHAVAAKSESSKSKSSRIRDRARNRDCAAPANPLHDICSEWGRRGGGRNTERQRAARAGNLDRGRRLTAMRHILIRDAVISWLGRYGRARLWTMRVTGTTPGVAATVLARFIGCSRQTVVRCLKEIVAMLRAGEVAGLDSPLDPSFSGHHTYPARFGVVPRIGDMVFGAGCRCRILGWWADAGMSALVDWGDDIMSVERGRPFAIRPIATLGTGGLGL